MKGLLQGLTENPTYDIVVTGHSWGAAAGVYAAGELRKTYKNVELVYLSLLPLKLSNLHWTI